jgi:sulfite reductase beta subunit-like hemoprotein
MNTIANIKIAGDNAYRSKTTSKHVFEKHRMRITTPQPLVIPIVYNVKMRHLYAFLKKYTLIEDNG